MFAHVVAKAREDSWKDASLVGRLPTPVEVLRQHIGLHEDFIRRRQHRSRMGAKRYVIAVGRASADIAPALKAQTIARGIAATHDRGLLTCCDRRMCLQTERAKLA